MAQIKDLQRRLSEYLLVNLVKKGRMTPAEAAEEANMTVDEFEKQAALLPV